MKTKKYSAPWSDAEEAILKEHYSRMPQQELEKMLPLRTWSSIKWKANRMQVRRRARRGMGAGNLSFIQEDPLRYRTFKDFLVTVNKLDRLSRDKDAVIDAAMEHVRGVRYGYKGVKA